MMKSSLLIGALFLGTISANAQYQLPNGDFEGDVKEVGSNKVPANWNWFDTAEGNSFLVNSAKNNSYVDVINESGNKYVQVTEGYYIISPVNGNLTTGKIVANSADAADETNNYNYSDPTQDVGQKFSGKPDAVSFKYKVFKKSDGRLAQLKIVVHGAGRYQDPESENANYSDILWGRAIFQSGSTEGWKDDVVDFVLGDKAQEITPAAVLVSLSTDKEAGKGDKGDYIALDDLKFVYYSELASLTYDNKPITVQENMDLSDQKYDESKLSCTLTGKGATVDKSYNRVTGVLTLTVKGNDWTEQNQNQHVYTIQFEKPTPAPASEVAGTYNRWITVNLSGMDISESANNIEITKTGENTVKFSLEYFSLAPGGDNLGPVDITDAQLVYAEDGSIDIIAEKKPVVIPGLSNDDQIVSFPIALTANLSNLSKDKKLIATLDIPDAGVIVKVDDAPFTTIEENGILKVGGEIKSASVAAYVKGGSKANVIDLTGVTLAKELNSSNFSAEANNTLYMIADGQTLAGNNVIQNGTCENLVLTDGLTFNAPEEFTATNVTFNREFKAGNLSTVVLPFSFETANVNGTVYKLESVENGVLSFKSVEGTADANVPYLVKTEGDNLFKKSLTNATVAQTPETVENSIAGTGVTHVGNFGETMKITSDDQTSWYGYNKNGSFVKVLSGTVKPFRSAIMSTGAAPSSFALKLDGTVTGILNLENPNAKVDVYTVSGVCVRKNVPAASALNGLSRGVYIVGGQKVVK